ncbi:peptide chain release factor family protein [Desulfobacter latus]|uniref:Peptide chain release factor-like protein n=1 Tax=Desulfobacter latus TaxID=2292 RepID=A0A850TD01_9BACT|nr:peptide chain release factor-like protein [Desulfobacter latus]NWH06147.1 peptide chain release factor-like protein [Desulfobacter latus]
MPGPDIEKIRALEKRMDHLGIHKKDILEKFIKSSGRGGQKVNKSSSAVFLTHLPTQISVKFGKYRSQHLNRFMALRHLVEKIEQLKSGLPDVTARKLARIKKQKQRRRKKALNKVSGRKTN